MAVAVAETVPFSRNKQLPVAGPLHLIEADGEACRDSSQEFV